MLNISTNVGNILPHWKQYVKILIVQKKRIHHYL